MATTIDHHDQSPEMDAPGNSPDQSCLSHAIITTTNWSSPPPAFPVTPHDVAEPERPLEKSIEPFQSEVALSSSLTVVSPECQPDSAHPTDSAHPQQSKILSTEADPLPQSIHASTPPTVPVPLPATLPSPPASIENNNPAQTPLTADLPEPVHPPSPCAPAAAALHPDPSDRPASSDQTDISQDAPEHTLPTTNPSDNPESPSHTDDLASLGPPVAVKDFLPQSISDSLPPSDLNINHPSPNHSPSALAENPNPNCPISSVPALNTEQVDSSSAVVSSAVSPQVSNCPLGSTADQTSHHDHFAACSSPPRQDIAHTTASINSLSPLSDVPSAPSPTRVVESPNTASSQLPHPQPTSPLSYKRQPSPSMYENGVSSHSAEGFPYRVNGSAAATNGESAHKRPRLGNELPADSHMTSSLSHLTSNSSQKLNPSQLAASLHPTPTATKPPQSASEVSGFVPGTAGIRFTKDQHRFAVSVIKQLKKHRSAGPFNAPVDPVALNIPDYLNVIKQPMDLSTIETRLGKVGKPCYYGSAAQFVADVQLVFDNCYKYNGPPATSPFSRMALDLSIQFETQMKKMPPDEPISHASTSRSPSVAKLASKPKQSAETRAPVPASKRKSDLPAAPTSSFQPGHQNGAQKRRSSSPQQARKKSTKSTSLSASALTEGDSVNLHTARRTSMNESSSSQRPRSGAFEQTAYGAPDHGNNQYSSEQPTISNAKEELKFCKELLREVNKKAYSKFVWPFYEPVDIVKLAIPEYPKFVKKPMDLETMKQKLKNDEYPNGAAFAADFRLMLNNCFTFNPTGTYYECGKQLERLFEAKWTERPPEEIPAPVPPPVEPLHTTESQLVIQDLQLQLQQMNERLRTLGSANPALIAGHVIPGTGPPKKHPTSRASVPSKSSPNLNIPAPLVTPSTLSTASKGKVAGSAKPKQANGGARRKSAGSAMTPAAKRQSQSLEQQTLPGQPDQPEHVHVPHQLVPPAAATLPPITPSTGTQGFSGSDYFEKIDYEQKKDLATQIQNAVEPMQSDAINLIRNSRPDLVAADGEEIELDIDALDDRTLYQLYQLVCAPLLPPIKPKKPKATAANGKPKASRKAVSGATRKSMPTPTSSYVAPMSQVSGGPHAESISAGPYFTAQTLNGLDHGPKPKAKKPRASVPGGAPKRKGIDETQETARIRKMEAKLGLFKESDSPAHPLNQSNGVPSANQALGPNASAPPAGPVEYASSSSESETESDDDSD